MNQFKDFLEYILNAVKIWIIVQPWQTGIIVRNGNKIREVSAGIFFRIPYFDSVFIQENRLRVISLPIQTITTKDGFTITLSASLGYSIESIKTLYKTLYHPETTLQNIAMSYLSEYIYKTDLKQITPIEIEKLIITELAKEDYGLIFKYFKTTNFAVVKTFRLIQDRSEVYEGLYMNNKT
jgi:hypothetical protein